MRVAIDKNDQSFLEQLHRMCGGSVQEICDVVGVTATAIRQRVTRLEAAGLIVCESLKAGRGRPRNIYRVSDAGLRHLGENYRDLALILWRTLHQVDDPAFKSQLFSAIRDAFVSRFGKVALTGSIHNRVSQLRDELVSQGYDFELAMAENGLPVLREVSCPYQGLASSDSSICEMESTVFSQLLNADVSLGQCCMDGHSCCEFVVSEK